MKDHERFRTQAKKLAHRGNSSYGEKTEKDFAAFHHRLAFRDLKEGLQPLYSPKGEAMIIFNGELYGFQTLREELKTKYEFQTNSDTEVILAAYLVLGKEKFLQRLDGEFAFVLIDFQRKVFLAARDVFGVKPLFFASESFSSTAQELNFHKIDYTFSTSSALFFSSEIKGLPLALRWKQKGLERQMLGLYEEMGTAFEGVFQIAPGSLLEGQWLEEKLLLKMSRQSPKRRSLPKAKEFSLAAQDLKALVLKAVRQKLEADVPLGAYLSGGIDSQIAAYAMSKLQTKIATFTVGFEGKDYDESDRVAQFLQAYPNLSGKVLRTNQESLEYAYSHALYASELVQPYTNGSAKWWLSRFARRDVRGVLTGDGSDELFCGYPSYRYLAWWKFYEKNPSPLRAKLYGARMGGNTKAWEKGLSSLEDGSDLLASHREWGWEHPLHEQIRVMSALHLGEAQAREWRIHEKERLQSFVALDEGLSPMARWQNYFLHTHFPTHVLNWVGDRMEMANTLEGRPIYLTKEILDFTRSLPDHFLVRGLRDKAILRKAFAPELAAFARTPKKQFNAPFLFDSPLGKEYLSESALKRSGLIDPARITHARESLRSGLHPMQRSYAAMYLQNCLVVQLLDEYLVRGNTPQRDLAYEEDFLNRHTEKL